MSYRITFVLDWRVDTLQAREANHAKLHTLLQALMTLNMHDLRQHPECPSLYESGVVYEMEPKGQEDWPEIPVILRLHVGDCEDLACWRAAELQVRHGIAALPTFIWKKMASGGYLYHIQVLHPDGSIEDPSKRLGMK